jgi:hypothetical protein
VGHGVWGAASYRQLPKGRQLHLDNINSQLDVEGSALIGQEQIREDRNWKVEREARKHEKEYSTDTEAKRESQEGAVPAKKGEIKNLKCYEKV